MRTARIFVNEIAAATLEELTENKYRVTYDTEYRGAPISLTMPIKNLVYDFNQFPPFFEGLLPEGGMLEALLRKYKLDRNDYLGQILKVGRDVVGAVTIKEIS
jgi:serine/threonine-protein kinase HipA